MVVIHGVVGMVREEFTRAIKYYDEIQLQIIHKYIRQSRDPTLKYEICMYVAGHDIDWHRGRMHVDSAYRRQWVNTLVKNVPLGESIIAQGV
jgi:hypothetical protein